MLHRLQFTGLALLAAFMSHGDALLAQSTVQVQIENLQSEDGFFLTPLWVGFHGGDFDLFNGGEAASAGLEDLAEEGMLGALNGEFAGFGTSGAVLGPEGFAGAPVIDPGEIASDVFDIGVSDRFFSYASMVIPSNDAFIANGDPTAYELFDVDGNFNGTIVIDIFGSDIYDAGTEVNDGLGAAFSLIGGESTDEFGVVGLHPGLDNFLGTQTVAQTTIGSIPGSASPIARITITSVPEPSTATLIFGVMACGIFRRHRRI